MFNKRYEDCSECKGKCCKFFSVSTLYKNTLHTTGVPLHQCVSDLEPYPEKYYSLHDGIIIKNGNFIVMDHIKVEAKRTKRFGWCLIIHSKCKSLTDDSKCSIYDNRPLSCRNFNEDNADKYNVPIGCKLDVNGCLEEDFDTQEPQWLIGK